MNARTYLTRFFLLLTFLFAPIVLQAQDTSSMTGTVVDASGAVVPGAKVTLSNKLTGVSYTQTTDGKGSYRFAIVPPAEEYTVQFTHAGFSTATVDHVTLSVGITRTQNAKLTAGSDVTVEVSALDQAVTLNTTDASIGNNFSVELLNDLPIQDRASGITTLFTLQPGYANGSFVGARTDQNSVTVDGIDVNDIAAGSNLAVVAYAPVDSVEEFRGVVTGLIPSAGTGSGGQFQLVTKSGTNKFHGNINEYHRDTSTVANSWFNNFSNLPRTNYIRNQFGGALGGPILKDKLFFFFDFNDSRIIQSATSDPIVPLDTYRAGTIGYIFKNVNGAATGTPCTAASREASTPQCVGYLSGPQVAALDPKGIGFDSSLLAFINTRYPHANDLTVGDGINTGGFRFTGPSDNFLTDYVARVDYNLTKNQRLFVRGTVARNNLVRGLALFPTDSPNSLEVDRSYGYVISHIWQISSNKVNQLYYGDNISKLSFPSAFSPQAPLQFGFGGLSGPYSSASSQKRRVPIPEIRDDFNWTLGAHNLNFGGTFKFIKTNSNLTNDFSSISVGLGGLTTQLNASLRPANIRGGTTAPGLYDSLFTSALGRIAAISSNYNYTNAGVALPQGSGTNRAYRFYETEAYIGDTWKLRKDLTLTYGVRYQLYSVPYEVNGSESMQNQTFNGIFNARVAAGQAGIAGNNVAPLVTYNLGGKANKGPNLYSPSYKDFAPRFALAYNPSFLPKTVFNMSGALVYDRTVIDAIAFIQDQNSFLFQNSTGTVFGQTNANQALLTDPRLGANFSLGGATIPTAPAIGKPYTPYTSGGVPYGGPSGTGYAEIVDPGLKDPYSISLNAGMQQDFGLGFILKVNYAGRLGRRLLAQADAAQVVDFRDPVSGQYFSQAMANVTQELRAGTTVTAQPWFTNQSPYCTTNCLVANFGQLMQLGDIADFANALEENGLTAVGVNVDPQFALNPFVTNKGFSSYHGLLVTLTKNRSHGVQFDVNYTLSHSMDNVSAPANYIAANSPYINFVCDAHQPRACRGNSDFDVQNVINSNFVAQLPVGRGKTLAGHAPRWLDEAIGGWSVSGTPAWRSGLALGLVSNAFGASFNMNEPPIFNGNRGAVQAHVHKNSLGQVNLFNDALAFNPALAFTGPVGLTFGSRNNLRGPSAFSMDGGLAKVFPIVAGVDLKFRADFFNILNHPTFGNPSQVPGAGADITSGSFGQITSTSSTARVGQFSLRLEF